MRSSNSRVTLSDAKMHASRPTSSASLRSPSTSSLQISATHMPALVSLAPEQSVFRSLLRSPASTPSLHIDPQTPTSNNANRNRVLTPTQASLSSFISTRRSQLDTPTSSKPVAPTEHSEFSESRHKVELPASSTDPLTVLGPLVAADLAGNPAGDIESWLQSLFAPSDHRSLLIHHTERVSELLQATAHLPKPNSLRVTTACLVLQHLVRSNAFGMQSPLLQALLPTVFESIFVDFQSQTRSPTSMHDMLYSLKPFFVQVNLLNDVVLSHETRIQNIEKSMVKLTSQNFHLKRVLNEYAENNTPSNRFSLRSTFIAWQTRAKFQKLARVRALKYITFQSTMQLNQSAVEQSRNTTVVSAASRKLCYLSFKMWKNYTLSQKVRRTELQMQKLGLDGDYMLKLNKKIRQEERMSGNEGQDHSDEIPSVETTYVVDSPNVESSSSTPPVSDIPEGLGPNGMFSKRAEDPLKPTPLPGEYTRTEADFVRLDRQLHQSNLKLNTALADCEQLRNEVATLQNRLRVPQPAAGVAAAYFMPNAWADMEENMTKHDDRFINIRFQDQQLQNRREQDRLRVQIEELIHQRDEAQARFQQSQQNLFTTEQRVSELEAELEKRKKKDSVGRPVANPTVSQIKHAFVQTDAVSDVSDSRSSVLIAPPPEIKLQKWQKAESAVLQKLSHIKQDEVVNVLIAPPNPRHSVPFAVQSVMSTALCHQLIALSFRLSHFAPVAVPAFQLESIDLQTRQLPIELPPLPGSCISSVMKAYQQIAVNASGETLPKLPANVQLLFEIAVWQSKSKFDISKSLPLYVDLMDLRQPASRVQKFASDERQRRGRMEAVASVQPVVKPAGSPTSIATTSASSPKSADKSIQSGKSSKQVLLEAQQNEFTKLESAVLTGDPTGHVYLLPSEQTSALLRWFRRLMHDSKLMKSAPHHFEFRDITLIMLIEAMRRVLPAVVQMSESEVIWHDNSEPPELAVLCMTLIERLGLNDGNIITKRDLLSRQPDQMFCVLARLMVLDCGPWLLPVSTSCLHELHAYILALSRQLSIVRCRLANLPIPVSLVSNQNQTTVIESEADREVISQMQSSDHHDDTVSIKSYTEAGISMNELQETDSEIARELKADRANHIQRLRTQQRNAESQQRMSEFEQLQAIEAERRAKREQTEVALSSTLLKLQTRIDECETLYRRLIAVAIPTSVFLNEAIARVARSRLIHPIGTELDEEKLIEKSLSHKIVKPISTEPVFGAIAKPAEVELETLASEEEAAAWVQDALNAVSDRRNQQREIQEKRKEIRSQQHRISIFLQSLATKSAVEAAEPVQISQAPELTEGNPSNPSDTSVSTEQVAVPISQPTIDMAVEAPLVLSAIQNGYDPALPFASDDSASTTLLMNSDSTVALAESLDAFRSKWDSVDNMPTELDESELQLEDGEDAEEPDNARTDNDDPIDQSASQIEMQPKPPAIVLTDAECITKIQDLSVHFQSIGVELNVDLENTSPTSLIRWKQFSLQDITETLNQLKTFATPLMQVFRFYSAGSMVGSSKLMSSSEFTRFALDARVRSAEFTSEQIALLFLETCALNSSTGVSKLDSKSAIRQLNLGQSARSLTMSDFFSLIVAMSERCFGRSDRAHSRLPHQSRVLNEFALHQRLTRLCLEHILTHCCRLHSDPFRSYMCNDHVQSVLDIHELALIRVFKCYADMNIRGKSAADLKLSPVQTSGLAINVRQFHSMLLDAQLYSQMLTPRRVHWIFVSLYNLDASVQASTTHSLFFEEFCEALTAVTVFRCPDPFKPLHLRLHSFLMHELYPTLLLRVKHLKIAVDAIPLQLNMF